MDIALIDAGGANFGSVIHALDRLGHSPRRVRDADALGDPDRIILPGVGEAAGAMRLLRERGLVDALRDATAPTMGICLGMQLLFEHSEEGDVECLGLMSGRVRKLQPGQGIRVPHMGWNVLNTMADSPLLSGVEAGAQAYFVHSYAVPVNSTCIARTTHGSDFAGIVQQDHRCGAQFHPEKSSKVGERVLGNFLRWAP